MCVLSVLPSAADSGARLCAMARDEAGVATIDDFLEMTCGLAIDKLKRTSVAQDPDRTSITLAKVGHVGPGDLDAHVCLLELLFDEVSIVKHFTTFVAAFRSLDDRHENKLTQSSNPLFVISWAKGEAAKLSAIWQYAMRRLAGKKAPDGTTRVFQSNCVAVQRLRRMQDSRTAMQRISGNGASIVSSNGASIATASSQAMAPVCPFLDGNDEDSQASSGVEVVGFWDAVPCPFDSHEEEPEEEEGDEVEIVESQEAAPCPFDSHEEEPWEEGDGHEQGEIELIDLNEEENEEHTEEAHAKDDWIQRQRKALKGFSASSRTIGDNHTPIGLFENIALAERSNDKPIKIASRGGARKRPASASGDLSPAVAKAKGTIHKKPASASGAGDVAGKAFLDNLDPAFKDSVQEMLPVWLWPQKLGKEGAKSYCIESTCRARLTFIRSSEKLSVTIERTCLCQGGDAVRKTLTYPNGGFREWWPAIRTIACDCDEKDAWGNDS
jgi:hypothetical protein